MSQSSTEFKSNRSPIQEGQLAPHSIEAEEAVLGSILLNPDALTAAASILSAESFFLVRHGWIFEAMQKSMALLNACDHLTVISILEEEGRLAEVGGAAYIISLINKTPSALNVMGYARIVWRMWWRRQGIDYAQFVARQMHSDETDIQVVRSNVEKAWRKLGSGGIAQSHTWQSLSKDYLDEQEQGPRERLTTGFEMLDRMFGGAYGYGQMALFAAYTNAGKSHLGAQLADTSADYGPTLYVSLESPPADVRDMILAARAGVSETAIKDRTLTDEERVRVLAVLSETEGRILDIDGLRTIDEIKTRMSELSARADFKPGMVFIDDVDSLAGLRGGSYSEGSDHAKLKAVSIELLALAVDTGWGVVGLKQILIPRPNVTREIMQVRDPKLRSERFYDLLVPGINSVEGGSTIIQKGGSVVGMLSSDWIRSKIWDGFNDSRLPPGKVTFYGLKFRGRSHTAVSTGPLAWNPRIPRFEDVPALAARREEPFIAGRHDPAEEMEGVI